MIKENDGFRNKAKDAIADIKKAQAQTERARVLASLLSSGKDEDNEKIISDAPKAIEEFKKDMDDATKLVESLQLNLDKANSTVDRLSALTTLTEN